MTRRPKKSEMLEVRLSHADKEALKCKAALEGSTVSATVRRLIADYLQEPDPVAVQSPLTRLYMILLKHPRKSIAAFASTVAASLLIVPAAHADPVKLAFDLEYTMPAFDGDDTLEPAGLRTRRSQTEAHMDSGSAICIRLDRQDECHPDTLDADGLAMVISVDRTDAAVMVRMGVMDGTERIAEPTLMVVPGETGSFLVDGENGQRFSLSVTSIEG